VTISVLRLGRWWWAVPETALTKVKLGLNSEPPQVWSQTVHPCRCPHAGHGKRRTLIAVIWTMSPSEDNSADGQRQASLYTVEAIRIALGSSCATNSARRATWSTAVNFTKRNVRWHYLNKERPS